MTPASTMLSAAAAVALCLGLSCASAQLLPVPTDLPALGRDVRLPNPYRGDARAIEAGAAAYEQHCAVCHGESATRPVPEGPDLRRLNSYCKRLSEVRLQAHCLRDVDTYFMHSVREGKLRAGLMHMPAWKDTLPQELIWAIRSFTETRPVPPPRTLPDLPPEGMSIPVGSPPSR